MDVREDTAVRHSAGVLPFRRTPGGALEVLIGHMGGPFWARKEQRAWSLLKGEPAPDEDPLAAARREFAEETGLDVPPGELLELGEIRQSGGKVVTAFAVEADLDVTAVVPGTFTLEWPPRSGRLQEFPEMDRVAWVPVEKARELLVAAQAELLDRLVARLRE